MNPARRRAALLFGAFCAALLVTALVASYPALERRFHLEVLRRDANRFEEMLLSRKAAKNEAAVDFVREEAGKEALFGLYLAEYDQSDVSLGTGDMLRRTAPGSKGLIALSRTHVNCQTWTTPPGYSSYSISNVPTDALRRAAILRLIPALVGRTFSLAGFPNLQFQLAPVENGEIVPPEWPEWMGQPCPAPPNNARTVCFFYRGPIVCKTR